jgi:hypothetical protein
LAVMCNTPADGPAHRSNRTAAVRVGVHLVMLRAVRVDQPALAETSKRTFAAILQQALEKLFSNCSLRRVRRTRRSAWWSRH